MKTTTDTVAAHKKRGPTKRHWWRRAVKVTGVVVGAFVALFLLIGVVVGFILTPPRLTPLVNRLASQYLEATVHFDTVSLSLFRHFPHVTLELKNGEVISRAFDGDSTARIGMPSAADTLLRFGEFGLTLNLPRLLGGQLAIRELRLTDPHIYAYVAPSGKANWEIYAVDTLQADTTATDLDMIFGVRVRQLVLERGVVVYESRPDSLLLTAAPLDLRLTGARHQRYEIDFLGEVSLQEGREPLCQRLPLGLKGGFDFDTKQTGVVTLRKLALRVNDIPVVFDGTAKVTAESIQSDVTCTINPLSFSKVLAAVPAEMAPSLHKIQTDLSADLRTHVQGTYRFDTGALPSITLDCKVGAGTLGYQGAKSRIDRLSMDASFYLRPHAPDSTGVVLRGLHAKGTWLDLSAEGAAWNLSGDARLRGKMKGKIRLGILSDLLTEQKTGIAASGTVGVDADLSCRMSQLNARRIGEGRIRAAVELEGLHVNLLRDTVELWADGARIELGANANRPEQDTLIDAGRQVVYLNVLADTMAVNLKNQMAVMVGGARLKMRNAASALKGDTTIVHPFVGAIEARHSEINGLDSTWIITKDASTDFSILPSDRDPQIPKIKLRVGAMELSMRGHENYYVLDGADVEFEATMSRSRYQERLRREHRLDSLQLLYPDTPRDSLLAHVRALRDAGRGARVKDEFADEDLSFKVDRQFGKLLQEWNAKGRVSAIQGRVVTPFFPLPTTLKQVDLSFTTDRVELRGTKIHAGVSELSLTGSIENMKRALLGRGDLTVNMQIESDTLDLNELIKTANAGVAYISSSASYKDSLKQATSEEHLREMIAQKQEQDTLAESSLVVIPGGVDMDIDLDVHYGVYADVTMHKLSGCLIVKDRCLQLNDLTARTDAGDMTLTALYATRSPRDITTGFDLEMKKMQVERLIHLIPSVDTLLPMLRSFEGVVDCQIAATAALDSSMNILLPTLDAACRIHGERMVLLDGETFTEIAKMLHFKNKKQNLIDKISVELLVHDNQIEMFPFVIEMDRYRAAVSGVQKLDMSFNYHISVLKSPIPFRLGVDIFGTPEKFKFRICRARYKSVDLPTYVELIDSTRINLRRKITDIFHKGVEAATLSGLSITPKVSMPEEALQQSEALTAEDTVQMRLHGMLPPDTTAQGVIDTLALPQSASQEPAAAEASDASSKRSSRRAAKKLRADAVLPAENKNDKE